MLEQDVCPALYSYAGLFQSDEKWLHPTRVINSYEIILVLAGTVCLFEEERRFELNPGSVIVLRPGLRHGGWRESEGKTSFYWIHFFADSPPSLSFDPIVLSDASRLTALCRQLLHTANTPLCPAYAVQSAFALLYFELGRAQTEQDTGLRAVSEAAEWIRINSQRRLTAAETAARSGYNPDYLSALFKSAYGLNLKQFIIEERMKRIRGQLLTTSDPLKLIAARLDFGSENQLIHFFRRHEGVSPARYRNLYHHTHLNKA